jgi:ATP-binding cassette, subfamily C, bacterial
MTLLPTASPAETRRTVWELLRPQRLRAAATVLVLFAGTAAGLAVPPVLGHIVDIVADDRPATALTGPAVLLLALALIQGVLTGLGTALVARVGEPVLAQLRERVVRRALWLPLGEVERAGSGDLLARVGDDVAATAQAVRNALPPFAISALAVGLTVVGLAALDWRLALAGLCAVPIQAWTLRWYLQRAAPLYAAERAAGSGRAQQLLDSIGGTSTVRAFGLGDSHTARIAARSGAAMDLSLSAVRLQTRFYGRLNAAEFVGTAAILLVGFVLVRDGKASIGEATAAALYFVRLFDPLNMLLGLIDDVQSATASLARLVGVARMPEPVEPPEPARPRDASVRVHGVSFGYAAGREVLHNVDLELAAGERVALVGVSGAGKTTLAKLIAGIHQASSGEIAIGGVPIGRLGPRATRSAVGLVTQEVHVFAGALADDLRLARPGATDEELAAALECVGALGWAQGLPEGLDTVIGLGGHRLGAAQSQQLALARLVLAGPPIAVLDEATAEAGSAGARMLEKSAAHALEGRTALVVAHRLTQAVEADRIVVLDGGRVRESGTHEELVSAGGAYAELWAAWTSSRAKTQT